MPRGGKRTGAGRPKEVLGWRDFCRSVIGDPRIQAAIKARALRNPDFALRVAEQGYGRPPQALDVSHRSEGPLEFRILDATGAIFAFGGGDLPTRSVPLPTEATE